MYDGGSCDNELHDAETTTAGLSRAKLDMHLHEIPADLHLGTVRRIRWLVIRSLLITDSQPAGKLPAGKSQNNDTERRRLI